MKKFIANLLGSILLLTVCCATLFAQAAGISQPVVANKYTYASVQKTATGNIWSTAQSSLNYQNAILYWVTAGSPGSCTLKPITGPTAALATLAVDDVNSSITCTSSGQKTVSGLNNYFNVDVFALETGQGKSVTVYVTLTNFSSNALAQTLSSVAQGNGAASPGTVPWYVQQSDGTNKGPVGDASARSKYVRVNDGSSHYMPAADAQARAVVITPGNGTDAFKAVKDGVGALGAGVQQVAELGTLSAPVASATLTQVVADPGVGASTVLLGVLIEKATATNGIVTVRYGTDVNCGTGTTTLLTIGVSTASSPMKIGFYPVHALVPAHKAVCLVTDAATTSARVLTQ